MSTDDSNIFRAWVGEQLEHQTDVLFNRVFWHGEDAIDTQCSKPGCPCGESDVEGPPEQQFKGIL